MLALCTHLWAGGAGSRFSGLADNILKQDPNLYEMVTNTFTIQEDGFLGPLEQRVVNGVLGMHYVYHEFKAISKNCKKHYILRIHFKEELANPKADRTFDNRLLDRVVVIPDKETPSTERQIKMQAEQDGSGQPATRPESK